ncbi:MAG: thioredoxin fold domain-containing protein [Arcobacter sp.]|jgi:thioredoxin-related protein|uniref:thioredoxin family protein n=1 Tax=Arcobacter sp. TaxID=1872629 RepID=UPI002A74A3D4|nr:thioredoxin fold domain-containing protein [Arcobacter sp.]MDY3200381.1 thioredoxin fold domain-containing protein [Arcobacter sp.]
MKSSFKRVMFLSFLIVTFFNFNVNAQEGKVIGGSMHEIPSWFKESFLDIKEDIEEAEAKNKHYMIFMDLEGCPYCAKMLKESFINENKTSDFIKKYFDVIELNVKGSREVTWDENTTLTEKELAEKLEIQYSPTILFFDDKKEIIVRVNGYRNPSDFKYILEYVQGEHYKKMSLTEYVNKIEKQNLYTFKDNKMFKNIKDLSKIKTPLAVVFEDGSCTQCDYFHDKVLKNKDVMDEFKKFTIVRFDTNSNDEIIDVDGNKTTAKQWAQTINLDYRPGILLYDNKKLISTIDALLYPFHFKELLRYVSGKYYEKYPKSYLDYLKVRQEELLKKGININLGE